MIEFRDLTHAFSADQPAALVGVNFQIQEGEFFSILGPSGCGKTTLLRLLSGFESPSSGSIWISGQNQAGIPPEKRPGHLVFQKGALFPHLSVRGNLEFSLKLLGWSSERRIARVREVLAWVHLEGYEDRSIASLSGGQAQRVAIARALVDSPPLLLLDEPFSALDLQLRKEMRLELAQLARQIKATFVLVTHDQDEALALSDRVAVLNRGVLEQVGTPEEIYLAPRSRFVAEFLGEHNRLNGDWMRPEDCELGALDSEAPSSSGSKKRTVVLVLERLFEGSTELWILQACETGASLADQPNIFRVRKLRGSRSTGAANWTPEVGQKALLSWDSARALWSDSR